MAKAPAVAAHELPRPSAPLVQAEAWERINAWHGGVFLKPPYVAVLLQCSEETLQTLRRKGTGPAYLKLGVKMSGDAKEAGPRQHIVYQKQDVVDWFKANGRSLDRTEEYHDKGVRAIKRFESAADLARALPFWIEAGGQVAGLVEQSSLEEFFERAAADWEIRWLPAAEAACRPWSDASSHAALASAIQPAIAGISRSIEAELKSAG